MKRSPQGVIRRYTFKLYPNKAQAEALDKMRRLHCTLYNGALQERIDAYRAKSHAKKEIVCVGTFINRNGEERGKYRPRHLSDGAGVYGRTLNHFGQGAEIKIIRANDPAYEAISADSMSFTLKRLDLAYKAFFSRAQSGAGFQSGFPRYKRSDRYPGFTHRPGQGWHFDAKPKARSGTTTFKGVPGAVKWRGEFPMFPYWIKTGDVTLRAGVWWLSVVADMPARMRADADHSGEVDFDLVDSFARVSCANSGHAAAMEETVFAAAEVGIIPVCSKGCAGAPEVCLQTSGDQWGPEAAGASARPEVCLQTSGDQWGDPTHAPEPEVCLQTSGDHGLKSLLSPRLEGEVSLQTSCDCGVGGKVKRGSCRDRSNKRREAQKQARKARQRREALHLWTTGIARQFTTLKITSPPLVEATKSGRGDEYQHGAEVALKAALNRHVLDQAPGAAIAMLQYKIAERGGRTETIVADGPVMVGNEIVEARKATRKTTRKPKGPRA